MFLQSQDFQRHTEHMMNSLYSSSQHAAEQLDAVDSHLGQSLQSIHSMNAALGDVTTSQDQQLQLAEQNLKGVQQLHDDSQAVQAQLPGPTQVRPSIAFVCYLFSLSVLQTGFPNLTLMVLSTGLQLVSVTPQPWTATWHLLLLFQERVTLSVHV